MFGLSIIIVNYKSHQLIADCLESIQRYGISCPHEIIIVDNESRDDGETYIRNQYPNVIWRAIGYNAGFARANNDGIRISRYDYVLLLNPDTIILEDAINKCFSLFSASKFAACGVQLLNGDYSLQISGSNFYPGGLNYALPIPVIGNVLKFLSWLLSMKPSHIRKSASVSQVEWINGAFIMFRRSAAIKVGLMDEDFFLYGEEIEWCSRLNKAGKLALFGECQVIHLVSGIIQAETSSKDNSYTNLFDKKGLQLMVSNHLMILKKFGVFWFFVHLLLHNVGMFLNLLFVPIKSLFLLISPKILIRDAFAYIVNVIRIWALLPKYLSRRPYFFKVL